MATCTTSSYVRFQRPFKLEGYRKTLPQGRYKIDTEEAWIDGLSFTARRRTQIRLHLQLDKNHLGTTESLILANPQDLYVALAQDKEAHTKVSGNELSRFFKEMRSTDFDNRALDRAEDEGML